MNNVLCTTTSSDKFQTRFTRQQSLKSEKSDSEMEEMDHSDSDSTSASDSSDSSENDEYNALDDAECLKRRHVCVGRMTEIEKRIISVTDQIYKEKIDKIDGTLDDIQREEAALYLESLRQMEENANIKFDAATTLRQMKHSAVANDNNAEIIAANQDYKERGDLITEEFKAEVRAEMRRLAEERNSIEISADIILAERGKKKRSSNNRGGAGGAGGVGGGVEKERQGQAAASRPRVPEYAAVANVKRKPITVTGPYIVYMLREADIIEDLKLIKKAMSIKCSKVKTEHLVPVAVTKAEILITR